MIEGLPGIGNVARASIDYLVNKLKARKIIELFSDVFPNSVTINDDSTIKMFSIEFYHTKINGRDLLLVSGDIQPTGDSESYALCKKIIELAKELGVSELVTLGGIGLPEPPDEPRVHVIINNESIKESLNGLDVIFDGNETVKIVLGAAGLLLGIASLEEINAFSLLAETINQSQHVGVKEAKKILTVITKYLGFKLDFDELDDEIKSYEEELKEESRLAGLADNNTIRQCYIG
jgi:hypothetical protein